MPRISILTDSTAQFTRPNFLGHELVYIVPFDLLPESNGKDSPRLNRSGVQQLIPPAPQDFLRFYQQLNREYEHVLVITLSSLLSPTTQNAKTAVSQFGNHASIQVVDSQTTTVGLGLLIQAAAGAALQGQSIQEVEHMVRAAIPRVYMLLCIPELTYLVHSGHLHRAQALVGEMMGLLPIFALEEGRLTPMEKVRTQRHLFESFQEFIDEFENPHHIALVRGGGHNTLRTRPLRQYVHENFPQTPFSEHQLSPHVAALFGPQSIALVIMESGEKENGK